MFDDSAECEDLLTWFEYHPAGVHLNNRAYASFFAVDALATSGRGKRCFPRR